MKKDNLSNQSIKTASLSSQHGSACVSRDLTHPNVVIDNKRFVDFSSFDYFGLNCDIRIKNSLAEAIQTTSWTTGSTRKIYGTSQELLNLETELAQWFQTKSAITFSSRNQAVFSLITNLVTERDLVLVDIDSTSPVSDAAFQVGATVNTLDLTDINWLETVRALSKRHPADGKVYCYFEEISSVHGSKVQSTFVIESLKKLSVIPICDVTYSLGFSAPTILNSKKGDITKEHLFIGSFGFSVPGIGAFIAGGETIGKLKNISSALLNEAALPPVLAKLNLNSIYLLNELYLKSSLLLEKSKEFRLKISQNSPVEIDTLIESPILTLNLPNSSAAKALYEHLLSNNILCSRVSRGILRSESSLIRLIVGLAHSEDHLLLVLRALSDTRRG